jgi:Cu/Zn superoxide dismutase
MKSLSGLFSLMVLLTVFSACEDHKVENVVSQKGLSLSAAQESAFNNSKAWGSADVSYDKVSHVLSYTIKWNDLTGNPTGAHIHGTAPRGTNAPVKHDFANLISKSPSGSFTNTVVVDGTSINETDLLNGLYYFNFHTPTNPGGEIRGQIEFYNQSHIISKKGLVLNGANEFPSNASTATGTADVTYNKTTKLLSFFLTWSNLAGIPTGSHIHGPALKGTNAPVKFDFFPLFPKTTSGSFSNSVIVDGTSLNEADLLAGKYYFNIHNSTFPAGEIRVQIEF